MKLRPAFLLLALLFAFAALDISAQSYPKKIDGYRVHVSSKSVVRSADSVGEKAGIKVSFGEPVIDAIGFSTGITLEVPVTVSGIKERGRIDRVSFSEFTVNGVAARIDDVTGPIEIGDSDRLALPRPLSVSIGLAGAAKTAFDKLYGESRKWHVKGRVFVFGRFRRSGFTFKRVVPFEVDLSVDDPITAPPAGGNY